MKPVRFRPMQAGLFSLAVAAATAPAGLAVLGVDLGSSARIPQVVGMAGEGEGGLKARGPVAANTSPIHAERSAPKPEMPGTGHSMHGGMPMGHGAH